MGDVFKVGDEVVAAILKLQKSNEVILAQLDHPAFKKRPLQSFSVGEPLTGTLQSTNKKYAFFDVGAMRAAALPLSSLGETSIQEEMKLKIAKVDQWFLDVEL